MINTVLVDDESFHLDSFGVILSKVIPEVNIIAKISSGKDALLMLPKLSVDLLFLDIMLGDMTAFELLEKLKNHHYPIIFVTAYEKYAVQAFKVNAIDYLLKPIDADELKAAVSKAMSTPFSVDKKHKLLADYNMEKSGSLMIKEKDTLTFISYSNILYCISDGNYTEIHYNDNGDEKHLLATKNLKYYHDQLTRFNFLRINQSVLINGSKVKKILKRKSQLILNNGTTFTIAKRRKAEIIKKLGGI